MADRPLNNEVSVKANGVPRNIGYKPPNNEPKPFDEWLSHFQSLSSDLTSKPQSKAKITPPTQEQVDAAIVKNKQETLFAKLLTEEKKSLLGRLISKIKSL